MLDHMVTLFLTLGGNCRLFSKAAAPFYMPSVMHVGSNSPHLCQQWISPVLLTTATLMHCGRILTSKSDK